LRQTQFSTPDSFLPIPGGFGDALSQMFGFGFNVYSFGLTLNLPIRNRAAAVDLADSMIRKKNDTLSLRNQQQNVRLDVLNSVTSLNAAKEQLKLANKTLEFANLNLDAANKKYELGTIQQIEVINAQQRKAVAESDLVQAQVSLRRALLNLQTRTGELLDDRGIVVPVQ
jgi:outer membrane protein TolC